MNFGSERLQRTFKNRQEIVYTDGKVPGTCAGMAAAAGALEESWVSNCNFTAPSPPIAGKPVLQQERPGCWKSLGDKDAVGDTQRWYSSARPVVTGWDSTRESDEPGNTWRWEKSWIMMDTNQDSLRTGQRFGLCKKADAC